MGKAIQQNPRTWAIKKVGERAMSVQRQPRKKVGRTTLKPPNLGCVGYYHVRGRLAK